MIFSSDRKPVTLAKKVFFSIAGLGGLFGFALAVYGFFDPAATTVSVNGSEVTGGTAFLAAIGSGLVPGVIFGAIGGLIAKLFDRAPKQAK